MLLPGRLVRRRLYTQSGGSKTLRERLAELIPLKRDQVKRVKERFGDQQLGAAVTVDQAYGGMRDVKSMIYETSLLHSEDGIRFQGLSVDECRRQLPKARETGSEEPLPEGFFWLLMTGEVPTAEQVHGLSADWTRRAKDHPIPGEVQRAIESVATTLHPMAQLSMAVLMLQSRSLFAKEYGRGPREELWGACFEDVNNLIAQLPSIASLIYRSRYGKKNLSSAASRGDVDWAKSLSLQMGYGDAKFHDLLRLYLGIHTDHEGGNVSAHAVKLVGSALSDPYYAYAAGMCGLAGPLHGLANQQVLEWLLALQRDVGSDAPDDAIRAYVWKQLKSGQVIPGYGHAVLRRTDPRYSCQRDFALRHLPNDPLVKLTAKLYDIVPAVLQEQGKTKNPWPNVDAHSGVLLQHYGVKEQDFYTVLFGVSRALGTLAALTWDRALMYPLERPKSFTTNAIEQMFSDRK